MAELLNLINTDIENVFIYMGESSEGILEVETVEEKYKSIPLPEEIDFKGLQPFDDAYKAINWDILKKSRMSENEETLVRILKIVEFGQFLCSLEQ